MTASADSAPQVVIVDDDPLVLAVTRRVLVRAGYAVAIFEDAQRALDEIVQSLPFAVVADLNMPDMGGCELLGIVRERAPRSLRILYTGEGQVQELEQGLAPGLVHAVLGKSGGMQLLPDTLARLRTDRAR